MVLGGRAIFVRCGGGFQDGEKEWEEQGQKRFGGLILVWLWAEAGANFTSSRVIKGSRDLGSESFIFEGWVGLMAWQAKRE